ncbi:hypothetical protein BV25DRAFT_1798366 [Artomyces pyxidatus]|uniref:Uncharacterized protein n=1 Tax=Artomyces pyxidatus TaxID=48021 RepID=A0ACB8TAA1_9AGAM|nr:hypothetical protein BV25DRAFT_1798366 [Artomyces pyxidatus]
MIATTTIAERANNEKSTCDLSDWEALKEMFARAAEQYELDDIAAALSLLRGVIHECHRFLLRYLDPSVLYLPPVHPRLSPETLTPPEERLYRDWESSERPRKSSPSPTRVVRKRERPSRSTDLPTAFHAILGITLFLFGNLVSQDPSLVLQGEPPSPIPYWLAALDVFETGENLPSRTNGFSGDAEDWRMAIVWGRTLVCLADEKISLMARAKTETDARIPVEEPKWPTDSPFHTIAVRRPPVTRRTSLATATPNDLMVLAMDQFSRGIFHMPHPQYAHTTSAIFSRPSTSSAVPIPVPVSPDALGFSRPKELFTIASEVLSVAERLQEADERRYWASWADSVFNQMKMEADMSEWRTRITIARGRCWLIAGSAKVDDLEDALEHGNSDILMSRDAEEAREGLAMAISFFDRAKGSASAASSETDLHELQPLVGLCLCVSKNPLTEALLSLANITIDDVQREELYSRAQAEGGDSIILSPSSESPNMSPTTNIHDPVVPMDES